MFLHQWFSYLHALHGIHCIYDSESDQCEATSKDQAIFLTVTLRDALQILKYDAIIGYWSVIIGLYCVGLDLVVMIIMTADNEDMRS